MGDVVMIIDAAERKLSLVEIYSVRAYWLDRGRLVEGRLEQFGSMESALGAAKRSAVKASATRVSRIRGNAEADYWEDAVTVAKFGDRAADLA